MVEPVPRHWLIQRGQTRAVDRIVGFDELRWLQELALKQRKKDVPEMIGSLLVARGLVERRNDGFVITARGRIALAKLG